MFTQALLLLLLLLQQHAYSFKLKSLPELCKKAAFALVFLGGGSAFGSTDLISSGSPLGTGEGGSTDLIPIQNPPSKIMKLMSPAPASAFSAIESAEQQIIDLFEENTQSVVFINTYISGKSINMNALQLPLGTGSGFVWSQQGSTGFIVTNYHVVRESNKAVVAVLGPDGKSATYAASVRGVDPDKDTAVLTIDLGDGVNLKPVKLGSSKNLRVGQSAFAIGNPFGLDHSLSTGVVSGLSREIKSVSNKPLSNVIQTDAAINPGNSGGPLLDARGRLIGMSTAIYTASGSNSGVGFAIPIDTLEQVVTALIRDGKIERAAIGISYLDSRQARVLGIDKGILVLNVPKDSAASRAGLQGTIRISDGSVRMGDIIVALDGTTIEDEKDLFNALDTKKPGQRVVLSVLRHDARLGLTGAPIRVDVALDLSKAVPSG